MTAHELVARLTASEHALSDQLGTLAPPMPLPVLLAATCLYVLLVLSVLFQARNRALAFVVAALSLRTIVSVFHGVTFGPAIAGQSIAALGSVAMIALGAISIRWADLALRQFMAFYLLITVTIVSGAINMTFGGLAEALLKFALWALIAVAVMQAFAARSGKAVTLAILATLTLPVALQLAALTMGISKSGENDGSVSYVGGYYHEASISIVLLTGLFVICMARSLSKAVRVFWTLLFVAGLLLADYRTAIIAATPLVLFACFSTFLGRVRPQQRAVFALILLIGGFAALTFDSGLIEMRFSDLGSADFSKVFQSPDSYSVAETRLLSGRLWIWSLYINGFAEADLLHKLIGHGPESWAGVFPLYAHNTFISYLYEFGVLGAAALLGFWASMFVAAWRVQGPLRPVLLAAHTSYLLLNLGTMPMWLIEGGILYACICGTTLYALRRAVTTRYAVIAEAEPLPAS